MHEFLHNNPILHGVYHSILILPLLYLAYVLLEFIEHKTSMAFKTVLQEEQHAGPIVSATFGLIPFCGISDLGAGLYAGKVISIGTLLALFLSTSGETLLLAANYPGKLLTVVFLLLIKFCLAVICGYVLDLCFGKRQAGIHIQDMCEDEHCECTHDSIWLAALKHTLPVFAFILSFNLLISILEMLGIIEALRLLVTAIPSLGVLFSAIIGLLPGCAPLALLLSLFGSGILSSSALLAGLLTSMGTGLIVLYKTNKSIKQNIFITFLIFAIGLFVGELFELTGLLVMLGI